MWLSWVRAAHISVELVKGHRAISLASLDSLIKCVQHLPGHPAVKSTKDPSSTIV